jgi:hypothetical protein
MHDSFIEIEGSDQILESKIMIMNKSRRRLRSAIMLMAALLNIAIVFGAGDADDIEVSAVRKKNGDLELLVVNVSKDAILCSNLEYCDGLIWTERGDEEILSKVKARGFESYSKHLIYLFEKHESTDSDSVKITIKADRLDLKDGFEIRAVQFWIVKEKIVKGSIVGSLVSSKTKVKDYKKE